MKCPICGGNSYYKLSEEYFCLDCEMIFPITWGG